jgi:hypothetical protein
MNLFSMGVTNPLLRNITITNASLTCGGPGHTNIINGDILMDGEIGIRVNAAYYIFNGNMSGDASVTIGMFSTGPGYIFFNGANTFAGNTTVTNSTLTGGGSVAGNLLVIEDGKLAPGLGVGTFTVNGDVTLAGTTVMQLAPGETPNSDTLSVGGTLTFGGTLVVEFAPDAAAPQAGDVYAFFSKGGTGAFAAIQLPDISALPGGLSWNTNSLDVDGTLRVSGTVVPPSITTTSLSDGSLIFGGEGGTEGSSYYVLSSTNVAAPANEWLSIATNVFGPGGTFSVTNTINPNTPELFFRLLIP